MDLPELPEWDPTGQGEHAELRVEFNQATPVTVSSPHWEHHWRDPDGIITLSLTRSGAAFILRAHQVADFRINDSLNYIEIEADPGTPRALIRHLLLDQVLPRVVAQRGRTVLHASAVSVNRSAVAFMGASGAGKSTVASWLHQKGYSLLCDDCVALDTDAADTGIIPAYPGARLWDDSPALLQPRPGSLQPIADYSDKLRLQVSSGTVQKTLPLKALLVLEPVSTADSEVSLVALGGAEAVVALVKHSFQFDMSETSRAAADLESLGAIVNRGLPIYRLSYPHTPAALTEIEQQLCSLPPGNICAG